MREKLLEPEWTVDAGPQEFNERSGVTAVGARMPLIAFNVNLLTDDVEVAKKIAGAVRHIGGGLRYVKAMGLELEEEGVVQVSMNLVNYRGTPIHRAVELVKAEAARYGVGVRNCELVGLVPIEALEEVVSYYLQIPEFGVEQVIEYHLLPGRRRGRVTRFRDMSLDAFGDALASHAATPGGGCASALSGALAAGLVAMVARTTIGEKFADRSAEMGEIAAEGDRLKDDLLALVDEDAEAFDRVMEAFRLPKGTPEEQEARSAAIQKAYSGATDPPMQVCVLSVRVLELAAAVAERGNPNAVSDAGVAALLAATALEGGALNVRINLGSMKDEAVRDTREAEVDDAQIRGRRLLDQVQAAVREQLS